METISLKIENPMNKKIEEIMKKHHYATKTEFVRESIRKNIDSIENKLTKEDIKRLRNGLGYGKRHGIKDPTPEEFEKIREEVGKRSLRDAGLL